MLWLRWLLLVPAGPPLSLQLALLYSPSWVVLAVEEGGSLMLPVPYEQTDGELEPIFQLTARFNIVLRKELLTFAAGAGGVSFCDCILRKKETQIAESIFCFVLGFFVIVAIVH